MDDLNTNLGNVIVDPNLISLNTSRRSNSSKPSNPRTNATPVVPKTPGKLKIETTKTPVYLNYQYKANQSAGTPGIDLFDGPTFPQFVKKLQLNQVIPGTKTKANREESSSFYITFVDSSNTLRSFVFSLMPAIETSLRGNNMGITVPEVKPGISFRTDMNTKRIPIPGARPVFQSLSIDKTIIQITAALIGNEEVITKQNSNYKSKIAITTNVRGNELNANTGANFAPVSKKFDAWSSAAYIDSNIVQTGRPITLTLNSNTSNIDENCNISIRCLFQSFRYLARYQDRCYYSLDLVSIDYLDKAAVNIAKTFSSKL